MREEIYLNLLDRAMEEELGLAVETNNPQRLSSILHEHSKLDKYAPLQICVPSIPEYVFIAHRTVELDDAKNPPNEHQPLP